MCASGREKWVGEQVIHAVFWRGAKAWLEVRLGPRGVRLQEGD